MTKPDRCLHDERFRIVNALNGCVACQCELEASEKTKARLELSAMRPVMEAAVAVIHGNDFGSSVGARLFDLRHAVEQYQSWLKAKEGG